MKSSTKVHPLEVTSDSKVCIIDRVCNVHLELEKVDGTLNTILTVGNAESDLQPSPKEMLNMLQLLADIVSPACEELEAIMKEMHDNDTAPPLPKWEKARVTKKGR